MILSQEQKVLYLEADYYDRYYKKNRWKSSTILSMSIGQGELLSTPIQMANLAVTIK